MAEHIFMKLSTVLFIPWIAGVLLSAILAAIMSTVSSQLLVVGSAIVNDIYHLFNKKTNEKRSMILSRFSIVIVTLIAIFIAWNPDSTVMGFVSYAWAGFGATFAPVILISLIWKRHTLLGALSGIILGAIGVVIWETFNLYEVTGFSAIVPCFLFSSFIIIIVSLCDKQPEKTIVNKFMEASKM